MQTFVRMLTEILVDRKVKAFVFFVLFFLKFYVDRGIRRRLSLLGMLKVISEYIVSNRNKLNTINSNSSISLV